MATRSVPRLYSHTTRGGSASDLLIASGWSHSAGADVLGGVAEYRQRLGARDS
ncbi:MAG TPA: hypothetical protein VE736_11430 [Gaiellaceae bacterium]|nr:hypothetical protein [Gaiellaceae bacterium]